MGCGLRPHHRSRGGQYVVAYGGPQPISVAELIFAELEFESITLVVAALALSLLSGGDDALVGGLPGNGSPALLVRAVHGDGVPHELHHLPTRHALRFQFVVDVLDGVRERAWLLAEVWNKQAGM